MILLAEQIGAWLGREASRIHDWWLRRRDRRLPRGFYGP